MRNNESHNFKASLPANRENELKGLQEFFHAQLEEWELARKNYDALKQVRSKMLTVGGCNIRVQFNPARIQSSAAKVDARSIQDRKCFLCPANLPAEQHRLSFGNDYQVLVNPYPIFPMHFTIPSLTHTAQRIADRYDDMLELARCMEGFTVFYNGPRCGASAPDHMHFQAGNKGFLPIEQEVKTAERQILVDVPAGKLYTLPHYPCKVYVLESKEREWMKLMFKKLHAALDIKEGEQEPMLNIITWNEGEHLASCIFPRAAHRPRCFYAEGEDNILLSPASVDMGGVFITPLEKDFIKITGKDIENILKEVCAI